MEAPGRKVAISLDTDDWSLRSNLTLPAEPMSLLDWLPFVQALGTYASRAAADGAREAGRRVSCAAGCAACCRHMAPVSPPEALALARLVESLPEPRRSEVRARFAAAVARARDAGLLDGAAAATRSREEQSRAYFNLQIACPFLDNELCSIHDARPLACREYLVTSPPEACATLDEARVSPLPTRVNLMESLARAGARTLGLPAAAIPLILSLEWSKTLDPARDRPGDPLEMLRVLLGEIGEFRVET